MATNLIIVGATARAAACSARRAGFNPISIDLFGDQDTSAVGRSIVVPMDLYPYGLVHQALKLDRSPCIYTGGLENHPHLIEMLADRHELWGNGPEVLKKVRDPIALADHLKRAGFQTPEVSLTPENVPSDGTWLIKPRASAGGVGIRLWDGIARESDPKESYYQEYIRGESGSALINAGHFACSLGFTTQMIGVPGLPFVYRGNIWSSRADSRLQNRLDSIGRVLAEWSGLQGLFGVDWIGRDGEVFVIEVNPRYPASTELFEHALGRAFLHNYADGYGDGSRQPFTGPNWAIGKLVVYAERPSSFPNFTHFKELGPYAPQIPRIADIPQPGTRFNPGEPMITLIDTAHTYQDCLAKLERRARGWQTRLEREATEAGD